MTEAPPSTGLRVMWLIKGLGRGGAEQLLVSHAATAGRGLTYEAAYVLPQKDALVPELTSRHVEVRCLGGGISWPKRLRDRLSNDPPVDVVHAHSPVPAAALRLITRTIPTRERPALVYTEHNRWPRYRLTTRLLNRATYGMDDHHILVSEDIRETLPSGHANTAEALVHGIDREHVLGFRSERDGAREELGVRDAEVLVVTVANLRPKKGYPFLLRAARRVLDAGVPVRFIAAGVGPEQAELEELRDRLGLGDRFHFLGFRDDALRLLAAGDIFCLASLHEGLPVSLMEAMTLGLPTVATRAGGIPEGIRDTVDGLLVPPGESDSLAGALLELVGDDDRRSEMGRRAAERSTMFDASRATARIEAIYREVTASRHSR